MTSRSPGLEDAGNREWDAIVIGAGPAGTLAAREIAKAGASVLLVERRAFPRWKVCGACLNGSGLGVLESVGLGDLPERLGAVPIVRFDLRYRGRSALLPLPAGVALSRARMDAALADEARNAGARVLGETTATVRPIVGGFRPVELTGQGCTVTALARVVIVAAGLGQHCARNESRLETRPASGSRMGAGCEIDDVGSAHSAGTLGMAVGRYGYVGLVRVENGRLNIAAAFERDWLRAMGCPGIAAAAVLAEAGFGPIMGLEDASWQGTVGLTRHAREAGAERLLLAGDAVGYVEPFTGEGMAWALAAGRTVAPLALRGIAKWEPSIAHEWTAVHRRLIGRRQRLCRVVAGLLRRPMFAGLAFQILARRPAVARPFLAHMNA